MRQQGSSSAIPFALAVSVKAAGRIAVSFFAPALKEKWVGHLVPKEWGAQGE